MVTQEVHPRGVLEHTQLSQSPKLPLPTESLKEIALSSSGVSISKFTNTLDAFDFIPLSVKENTLAQRSLCDQQLDKKGEGPYN